MEILVVVNTVEAEPLSSTTEDVVEPGQEEEDGGGCVDTGVSTPDPGQGSHDTQLERLLGRGDEEMTVLETISHLGGEAGLGQLVVQPGQPGEVELDELLALVPGCNNISGQTSRQTPRQCLTVILQLRLQDLPDGLGWSLDGRLLVRVLLGFERIVHLH